MLAKRLAACTCLSTTVSQLFELQTIVIFTYPCLHFLFALGTPVWQSRKTLHECKDNSVLAKLLAACTYLFNSFRVIRFLSQCVSQNRYFYHIFVSPGDAPGTITLNVVWMEREFDAYKLSRCMCPSNSNRFLDRARYWSKIVIFSYPLHSTPPVRRVPA